MIVTKVVDLGVANLCLAAAGDNHTEVFSNSGDGASFQFTYFVSGNAFTKNSNDEVVPLQGGQLIDFEDRMGMPFTGWTEQNPAVWVSVCPKPYTKRFDYQIVRGGESTSIIGDDKERVLVAIVGSIEANGKTITEHKFARINDGQQVSVVVPEGSVAVVLTTRT